MYNSQDKSFHSNLMDNFNTNFGGYNVVNFFKYRTYTQNDFLWGTHFDNITIRLNLGNDYNSVTFRTTYSNKLYL